MQFDQVRTRPVDETVILEAILDATHGPDVTLARLMEPFPADWEKQRLQVC